MRVSYPIALELHRLGFFGVQHYYNVFNRHLFRRALATPPESILAPSMEEALRWVESRYGIQTTPEDLLAALEKIQ